MYPQQQSSFDIASYLKEEGSKQAEFGQNPET
jgi:hypothetical protein